MTKPFKKLLGNRIYLNIPTIPESNIILSEEMKKELIITQQEKYRKLVVYAVGDASGYINEGDVVFVDPATIQNAPIIPLTETLNVLLISPSSIIHVW